MDDTNCAEIIKTLPLNSPISDTAKTLRMLGALAGPKDFVSMEISGELALAIARAIEAAERPRVVEVPVAAEEVSFLASIGMAAVIYAALWVIATLLGWA